MSARARSKCLRCDNAIWRDGPDRDWQSFADRGPNCKAAPPVDGKPGKHVPN